MNTEERMNIINQFSQLNYKKLKKLIIKDLNSNYASASILLKKYTRDQVEKFLESPDKNAEKLQEMSLFLYNVSQNYRRLIDYLCLLPTDNYWLSPNDTMVDNIDDFKQSYIDVARKYSRYSFKNILPNIRHTVFLKGIYFGVCYESKESFCLKELRTDYCKISSLEDGVFYFSFNLSFFDAYPRLLPEYGKDFEKAYRLYHGDVELGIPADKTKKWFEPKNQICVKLDNSQTDYSLPYFVGLFPAIMEIDIYKEIKKDKAVLDNYKVLAMQMDTDDNGVPKMEFDAAEKYYDQAAQNLPEGVGLILSPFKISDFSLQSSGTSDGDIAEEATKLFWENAGVSSLLFGLGDKPTSQSLELSIRPDEAIVYNINENIGKAFNTKFRKSNPDYMFSINFLDQSRFSVNTVIDSLTKSATYGLPVKSKLLAAQGLSPLDVLTMSFLEDTVLGFTEEMLRTPLLQSSTMSPDSENESGRPTNESKGIGTSDNTEIGQDNNTENR